MSLRFPRVAVLALGLAVVGSAANAQDNDRPAIAELETRVEDGRLVVSYRLEGVFSDNLQERIALGIPVSFRHRVQLLEAGPLWFDRVVGDARLDTSVAYDSLTKRYELSRTVTSGGTPKVESLTTDSFDAMREWMTAVDQFPSLDLPPDEPGQKLRLRVESVLGRRWLFLIPTARAVNAERELQP